MKKFYLAFLLLMGFAVQGLAQVPTVLGTDIVNGSYTTYDLTTVGGFKQYRLQAASSASISTRLWEFAMGTAAVPDYTTNWRPYTSGNTLSSNIFIPTSFANGAKYNTSSGGATGLLPAITSGNYYTFNVSNTAAADNTMQLLETSYSPLTILGVSKKPTGGTVLSTQAATITITTSGAPASGENVFVRYTTNAYSTSTLAQFSFAGSTGTATIPAQSAGSTVSYYVFSSNKSLAAINSDVTTYGQSPYDMSTLNLNNNSGSNFSYTVSGSPVLVTATGGTTSATYATLGAAFTAINAGTHTGTLNIYIGGNTTEASSAVLNASGAGSASYTTCAIQPTTAVTVSGTLATPLIDLNGADNVTIDGINSGGSTLTISNLSTSATAGTSTIRFIGDATSNTITNCTITGSSTLVTNSTIFFSTGTTTGNISNTISNNTITAAGANLPFNAIYSLGTSAAIPNTVTVSGNSISDYFNAAGVSVGINVGATGNNAWTISNNKLFQSATRLQTSATTINGIFIGVGGGYTISGNTIGFANSSGTGTTNYVGNSVSLTGTFPSSYTTTGTATATRYIGINCAFTAAGTNSLIQTNTIAGFALYTSSGATTTNGVWCGINIASGNATVGGASGGLGNIIGATSGLGSVYTACTTTGGTAVGIYATSANTVTIQNNSIGAIDAVGTTASIAGSITAIDAAGAGVFTISNNTVGNTTADNIRNGYTLSAGNLSNVGTLTSTSGTSAILAIRNASTGATFTSSTNTFRGWATSGTATTVTGITNTGAITTTETITSNALGTSTLDWMRYAVANSGSLTGISNSAGASTCGLSIQTNDIRGITYTVAGSGSHTYIVNSATSPATFTISSNTFTNLTVNTTGGITFLGHSGSFSATSVTNINSNSIVTAFNKTGAGGTIIIRTSASSTPAGAVVNFQNNTFSNMTFTGAITFTGYFDNDGGAPTKSITGNTFNNNNYGTGTVSQILGAAFNGNNTAISNNIITNQTTSSASITCINSGGSGTSTLNTVAGNTITGISSTGTGGTVIAISNASVATTTNINTNIINTLSSAGASSTVAGITSSAGTTVNINGNTINTLSGSGATSPLINGIAVSGGTTVNVYKNKLYDFSESAAISTTSPAVVGMVFSGGTTVTAYNNLVGDLRAPAASLTDAIRGIAVTSSTSSATYNLYYNTVYLNATSSGTNFGTTGIYHTTSTTSTTAALNLRNNIIVNTSTASGTGFTVAFRRSSGAASALANYASTSNNNLFYAGTAASPNFIYYDGTGSAATLSAYKAGAFTAGTISPRDQASVTENPTFISTAGSNANFLHINTAVATQVESGGSNSGLTTINGSPADDYDADLRQGSTGYAGTGTAPDIGADEGTFVLADIAGPTITYTALTNTLCTSNITLSATITDASNVNVTAGTKPRLYFKKSGDANTYAGNTSANNGWKYVEATNAATPFSFTTDYTLLQSAVVATDVIQYFIVAQDLAGAVNVSINSGTFAATPASVALTSAAFPLTGTINSYTISSGGIGVNVTIGAAGTYTSLTGASGLFAALNAGGLTANINATILDASVTETGAVALNQIAYGCASNYTLTIKPSTGITATLTGSVASGALIKLNGADYVTIDGSNSGGTDKSLTITNTNTTAPTAVSFASTGTGLGATNNTIKNCNINTGVATSIGYGISVGGSTPGTTGADNDNVTIQNNAITNAPVGIYATGTASVTSGGDDALAITSNSIDYNSTLASIGIQVGNALSSSISQNSVSEQTSATQSPTGISLETGFVSSTVTRNTITKSLTTNSGGYGGRGMTIGTGTATSALTIANNVILGVNGSNFSGYSNSSAMGIAIGMIGNSSTISTTAGGINLYYNSVSMTGSMGSGSTTAITTALYIGSGASALDIRDNVFANTQVGTNTTQKNYAIYSAVANTAFTTINYNDYFVSNTFNAASAIPGFLTSDRTNLAGIQAGFGGNANSIVADPLFNSSTTNLQPSTGSPVIAAGTFIAAVTTDINNVSRSGTTPTIGAYETSADNLAPTITYSTLSNTLCTSNITLSATITDASGINVTTGTKPRLYYKKSGDANTYAGNTSGNNGWKYVEATNAASPFSFTTDYTLLQSAVTTGDIIQYFVTAQDLAATPNVAINSGTFAATPTSVALTSAAFPLTGTINSYTINSGGIGTNVTIGAAGTYTNLTGASGLFAALNAGGLTANISATILDASVTETGAVALNAISYGCASNYTLTIKPNTAVTATLTGSLSSGALIKLNGADYVIIDGSNSGGTDRSLTITNTATTAPTAVSFASTGTGAGATNNTIKNCNISTGVATSIGYGISVGGSTPGTTGADNDNVTIQNNAITNAPVAIYATGTASVTSGGDDALAITGNSIDYNSTLASIGIQVGNALSSSISQNTVSEQTSTTQAPTGISLETGFVSSTVTRNTITKSLTTNTGGYGGRGITIGTGTATSALTIANNVVLGVNGSNFSGYSNSSAMGIAIGMIGNSSTISTTAGGINLYYNSVSMTGSMGSGSTTAITTALYIGSGASALDIRDNVLTNTQVGTSTTQKNYAIYSAVANTAFTTINYNDYFVSNTFNAGSAIPGFLSSDQTTIGAIQTAFGGNGNSIIADPLFNSSTANLQPSTGSPVIAAGTFIAAVTTDINNISRSGTTPTIGAYETAGDALAPTITYTAFAGTLCTSDRTLSATITDGSGINVTAGTKPRLYYKKSTDANTYAGNTSGNNGWKYVEATNAASPFSFTTNYTLLQTAVGSGDVIQYFVTAQDLAAIPNVAINSGTFAATPTSVALTSAAFPLTGTINSYTISSGGIGSDVTIGAAGTYTSLTGAGGLFSVLNAGGLTANINATILDASVSETGANALNAINYGCASSYTLTIKPATGVTTTLTGSSSTALIKLNGADNVIIDGSNNGSSSRNMTITNTNTGTTAAVIQGASPSASDGITNDVIKNCIISGSSSTTTGFGIAFGGTTVASVALTANSTNTIQNNQITGVQIAINILGTSSTTLDANNIVTLNNLGTSSLALGLLGIQVQNQNGISISQNDVQNISSSGSTNIKGIALIESKSASVTGNTIHKITYTGASTTKIYALNTSSGTSFGTSGNPSANTFSNNLVYDITSNCTSSLWNTSGINDDGGYGDKFYFNSVYLNAATVSNSTSGGYPVAAFSNGNASIGTAASAIDVRDNIFSITGTAGFATSTFYTNYTAGTYTTSTVNYNDLYMNVTGVNGYIGFISATSYAAIGTWRTATGQEANSISTDPLFYSTTDLRLNIGSPVVAAGTTISGITTDYAGVTRGSPPTIGAYETASDVIAPTVTYTLLSNTLCTSNITLSATITDASGVNVTAGTKPRLYYKKSTDANTYAGNTSGNNGWKYVEATNAATPFSFTTDYTLLQSAVTTGDVIQYFVTAQDLAATPNVAINSGTFAATPTSVALTSAAFPLTGTINSYTINGGGIGTNVTIGAAGTYTSLTGASGLFAALNAGGLTANISATILDASVTETGAVALNAISYGCASNYTLTIKPNTAVTATLTGSLSSGALIKLNGADYVTIDGSNAGGTDKSLTIINTATTAPTAVSFASTGTGAGATNNTIKNCNISTGVATSIGYGISVGGSTPGTTGADNDNVTIQNNAITNAPVGIYATGIASVTSGGDDALAITGNSIDYNSTLASIGIQVGNALSSSISQNSVSEQTSATQSPTGISLETGFVSSTVTRNTITKSLTTNTSGYGGRGITVGTGTATSALTIANNVVLGVNGSNWSSFGASSSMGIAIGTIGSSSTLSTITGGVNLYYNSVSMAGSMGSGSTSAITTALYIGSGASALDIRDNVLANTQVGTSTTQKNYAIYSAVANTAFTTINYNDYFVSNTFNAGSAIPGFLSSDQTTIGAIQTAFGGNGNSIIADPLFNSSTANLQPSTGSPVIAAGTFIAAVTTDINNISRSGTTPTIGAYETAGDALAPTITYTLVSNTLCTSNITLSATITDASGVNITTGTKPRLYYKKSTDANTYVGNTSGNNGWKYVEATNAASPFSFTTDYTLLQSAVVAGDVIQYFVTAQDLFTTPNVAINSGVFAATPASVALTSAAFPLTGTINSYTIISGGIGSNVTIGAAGTYTSLTGASGLFAALNAGGLTANISATILDASVTETGAVALNQIGYGCASNYTLTIKPATGVTATLTGSSSTALIKLNGADYVTFDGSNNGSTSKNLTITNTNAGTSSAVLWLASATASDGATNNTIKNTIITGNASTTTLMGIFSGGTSSISTTGNALTANSTNTLQNNTVSKTQYGIYVIGVSSASLGSGWSINTNVLGSSTAGDGFQIAGIVAKNQTAMTISGNDVQNITGTSGTSDLAFNTIMAGIYIENVSSSTVSANKIHFINYSGTSVNKVYGLNTASTFTTIGNPSANTFVNNMVYDLVSSGTSASWNTSGINDNGGYNDKFYYNSVYLTGQMSGTGGTAGSAAFSNGNGISATNSSVIDVRNNAFYMKGSSAAAATLYAHYTTVTTYSGSSVNYNDLISTASGSATAKIGRFNTTDYTTLANWQSATSQDANSLSVDPLFTSTTDLHLQSGSPLDTKATPIAGITTDIDGGTRDVTTPDIGADEFTPAANDAGITGLVSTAFCPGTQSVQVVLKNFGTATLTSAKIDWTVTANGTPFVQTQNTFTGSLASGASTNVTLTPTYNFVAGVNYTITATTSLPNGVADGNTANDSYTTGTFQTSLNGTYTVGSGGNYTTLTAAVAAANTSGLCGPTVFSLTDATYGSETFPITINSLSGASSTNTLTIKPASGVTSAISGSSASGLIILNGADYVTIDGSNAATANTVCPASAATRNLTLTNTNTGTSSAVVWLQTTAGADAATNNTVESCNLTGSGVTQTLFGAGSGSATISTSSLGTSNNSNSFINNNISGVQYGIYSQGASSAGKNSGTIINQNIITTSANTKGGIWVGFENSITISGNSVSNIAQASSPDVFGITLGFGTSITATTSTGNEVTNATVSKNIIGSVVNSATFSAYGIGISAATSGTTTISNNMIYGVSANGTSGDFSAGIVLGGGTGSTTNVYYNTVSMQGTISGATSATQTSACLAVTNSTSPTLNLKNNIFSNTQLGNSGATLRFASIALAYSTYTGLTSTNNDLYSAGAGPGTYTVGITGTVVGGTNSVTLGDWQTTTGQGAGSVTVLPVFISTTNLHLNNSSNSSLDGTGAAGTGITDDIDCATRNVSTPDIGADEFTTCPAVSIAPVPPSICAGGGPVQLTASSTNDPNYTYTWLAPISATGAVQSVSPSSTTTYTVNASDNTTGNTYSGCTTSASVTVTVNPLPTISVNPISASICSGGSAILLTASGANSSNNYSGSSGTLNTSIPDVSSTGINSTIAVSGIAGGATVDSVIVTFNINISSFDEDMVVDLEAPNGQIINLVGGVGSSVTGSNFTNTRITSNTSASALSSGTAPYTGTFKADALTSGFQLTPSPTPTTSTFSNLFSTPNGNWKIRVYDDESAVTGVLADWSLKIAYSTAAATYTWAPSGIGSGLYTDAGATTTYTGGATPSVYAKPAVNTVYTVTGLDANGCSNTATSTISIGGLSGTYSVGSSNVGGEAGHYSTLTEAASAYSSSCITGPVVFALTSTTYSSGETFPISFGNTAASIANTLTITPSSASARTISGSAANNALIKMLGNYIIIDGQYNSGGTNYLTITNTSITSPSVVLFGSTGTTPVTNDTLRNCIITNGVNTSSAVVLSDATTLGNAGYFNNIAIQNNTIQKAYVGIYSRAVSSAGNGSGLYINSNALNSTGSNQIANIGIYVEGVDGGTVSGNTIGNFETATSEYDEGIWLGNNTVNTTASGNTITALSYTGSSSYAPDGIYINPGVASANLTISGNTVNNISSSGSTYPTGIDIGASANGGITITKNKVSTIKNTNVSGWGAVGILSESTSSTANTTISNNFIWDVYAYGFAGNGVNDNGYGLAINGGAGYKIYYNSVYLTTNQTLAAGLPAAMYVGSAVTGSGAIDMRNNIFQNGQTLGTQRYAIYSAAASTVYSTINYNDYFTTGGFNLGFISSSRLDISAWRTGTGQDVNSLSITPSFVSTTDLHLNAASGMDTKATPLVAVTDDIDADTRDAATPDIGADEFIANTIAYYYKTRAGGDWNSVSTWTYCATQAGVYSNCTTQIPIANASGVEIMSGHTVTITSAVSANNVIVDAGGTLTQSSNVAFNISTNGAGWDASTTDFIVNGIYNINGAVPTFASGATAEIRTGGVVKVLTNTSPNLGDDFARPADYPNVLFKTGSVFEWNTSAFQTTGATYFNSGTEQPIFRVTANVGSVGSSSTTTFNGKFEASSTGSITFQNSGTKIFRDGFGGTGGTITHKGGTIAGDNASGPFQVTSATAVIDGTVILNLQNNSFVTNSELQIPTGASVTVSGAPVINVGTSLFTGSELAVDGTLTHNGTAAIDLTYGNLTVSGDLAFASTGSFKAKSAAPSITNISFTGTGTNPTNPALLTFSSGFGHVNNFSLNRSAATTKVYLGADMTINGNLVLTKGILVNGNNLITWANSGGTYTAPAAVADSWIATCDATGTPLTTTNGTKGFRINNVGSSTDVFFPVGATYSNSGSGFTATPNRMMINNLGTTDFFTVVVAKGDIGNSPKPRVNRIWYVTEGVAGGSKVTMKLYFTKRDWSGTWPVTEDEVESGFLWNDVHLIQENNSNQFLTNSNSTDVSGIDYTAGVYTNTEVYAQFTRGVGINIDGSANVNGVTVFNKFGVVNAAGIILPVTITDLRASLQNSAVQLTWTSLNEINIDHYEIERSTNAISFNGIGSKTALNNGSLQTAYGFTDLTPASGKNYYRIKVVEKDGHSSYTNVVLIETVNGKIAVTIAPNPVINKKVMVTLVNAPAGKYNCILFAANGQKIWERSLLHEGGSSQYSIRLPASLAQGVYFMHVENTDIQVVTKLLIQ